MSKHHRRTGPYAAVLRHLNAPPERRRPISRQTLCHYRRIQRHLPRALGLDLDRRGAPFFIVRWIAWADDDAEMRRRYDAAVQAKARGGRWPRGNELLCRDDDSDSFSGQEALAANDEKRRAG